MADDLTDYFNTPLSPEEQKDYDSKFSPKDSYDYDMAGWYKANPDVSPNAEGQHYPDTYKKPNHPTFSDESQYHNMETVDPQSGYYAGVLQGGHWGKDGDKDTFTPGPTNHEYHTPQEMQDYFNKTEPKSQLILPDIHPEPYGLNPPDREPTPEAPPGPEAKVLFKTSSPLVNITDQDIDQGINVALGAGPASLENSGYKNYIDMFLKQPEQLKTGELKPYTGDKVTIPITENGEHWMSGQEAADHFHETYQNSGSNKAIQFAHEYETSANPKQFDIYEALVNDPKKYPNSKAFDTVSTPSGKAYDADKFFEQIPALDTQAIKNFDKYTKEEMKPENFYKIDPFALNKKQTADLDDLYTDFKNGNLSTGEYLDEIHEYEKFSSGKGAMALNHGDKVITDLLDDYPELTGALSNSKLTPKEKFLQAAEEIHGKFASTIANARDKFTNLAKQEIMEPKIIPPTEAAAAGYTQPAYRGMKVYPGKEVNPVYKFDEDTGQMYSTASPMLADMYADYLSKHPGYKIPPGTFKEGAQVMPLYINTKDYHYYDAKGGHWTTSNPRAMEEARKAGKKGVIVDNVRDEPGSTTSLPPKKIFITFPSGASTVKSRFAKSFDPSSPNIMHGIGSVAAVGGAAGFLTNEKADDLSE